MRAKPQNNGGTCQLYTVAHICNAQTTISVHKCIFQCTNMFQCTNVFFSTQICFSAEIYFSVHKFPSAQNYFWHPIVGSASLMSQTSRKRASPSELAAPAAKQFPTFRQFLDRKSEERRDHFKQSK